MRELTQNRPIIDYPIDITVMMVVVLVKYEVRWIYLLQVILEMLSLSEPVIEELFQYRFKENQIEGHSLGNLLLATLTNIKNDFGHAVKELSKILNIKGKVIPSTNTNVMLNAVLEDGEIVRGESQIPKKNKRIDRVLEPENVEPMEEAIDALEDADLIVLGPGSLYTSVISNLCVKGMSEAILRSKAPKLYISNVMTQPGETSDYDVMDHIQAIHKHVEVILLIMSSVVMINTMIKC